MEMMLAVADTDPSGGNSVGSRTIREKLVYLHEKMLGETLTTSDAEIEASYQLLVDSWQDRLNFIEERGDWAWAWPEENCQFYLSEQWEAEDGIGNRGNDPTGMKNTWMSMLIYLMTDFSYLHE